MFVTEIDTQIPTELNTRDQERDSELRKTLAKCRKLLTAWVDVFHDFEGIEITSEVFTAQDLQLNINFTIKAIKESEIQDE